MTQSSYHSKLTAAQLTVRLLVLMILDAEASFFIITLLSDGFWQLGVLLGLITLGLNYIFLKEDAYPLRWISPGLSFLILLSLYPIVFTVYIAFTNFGTGHLLPKKEAVAVLTQRQFSPETGGITYNYTVFQSPDGHFALWLQPRESNGPGFLALPAGETDRQPVPGPLDDKGIPTDIAGYTALNRIKLVQALSSLQDLEFTAGNTTVQLTSQLGVAAASEQRYLYDPAADTILDRKTTVLYRADESRGSFISDAGEELLPGYQVNVGGRNFARFFNNPSFRGPLLSIFTWTFIFALLSVLLAFSLGLLIALAFGRNMPFQKLIKALLIIPYAIPNVITILVWRGMLNPLNGVISTTLAHLLGQPTGWPPIFADPWWVKGALIMINVWLAYPYFMLINSGALQAIPTEMYEAADLDGANSWQKFWHLTLPMLLVGVGPLVLGSFTTNFNALNVVYLFNQGGPPMVGTSTPAGHSDILISYVYRLAFGGGSGQDFGYASAISMIIFSILAIITLFQYRFMKVWEKAGENV